MEKDLSESGPSRRWWLLMPLVVAAIALVVVVILRQPAPTPVTPIPVQVQSTPWRVGADVELTLQTTSPCADQVISLTLLAPGPGQPQIEGLSPEYFGLSGVQIPWLLPVYREPEMTLAAASGARYIGLDFDWQRIEPKPGRHNWEDTDEAVALAKRHGLRLVPMLLFTPRWASTASFAPLDHHHAPPIDYADYRAFVYAVVERYKPHGSSPLTNDGYGITDWVIWNEPNVRSHQEDPQPGDFWTGSLEEYLLLLRAGYEGAHAADPGCNVLNGGFADLFWMEPELYLVTALERFYDPNGDGYADDGARPFFDTLNIHTYQLGTPDAAWYTERLAAVLEIMERFGDGQKRIWITETGYGSVRDPPADSPFVDEQTQAHAVRLIYEAVSAYPQVERVFWWSLRDYHANAAASNEAMEGHYGLLRANFEPKPAYLAFGRLTGRLGQVLTMTASTDEQGIAHLNVPASFVTQPGEYVAFVTLDEAAPTVVVSYDADLHAASDRRRAVPFPRDGEESAQIGRACEVHTEEATPGGG
jgi:hypothetical protein